MKNNVVTQLVAAMAIGLVSQANAYQVEISGAYGNIDAGAVDSDLYTVGGEFYIDGVSTRSGPLFEAAFLNQASSIRGFYQDIDTFNSSVDGIIVGGRFIDKASGFLFDANVATGDLDGYTLGVGFYIDKNSTVIANYIEVDDFTDGFGIEYKNVLTQNNGTYVNIEGGIEYLKDDSFDEKVTTYSVGADYYFNKTMSLGVNVGVESGDAQDSTTFGIRGSLFLAENISLQASLAKTDIDGANDNLTSMLIGGAVRF